MDWIGQRFTAAREKGKEHAYRQLQKDLMNHMGTLSHPLTGVISMKDLLTKTHELEEFLKGSVGQSSISPLEALSIFIETGEMPKK